VRRENRSLLQATSAVARKSLMNAGRTSSEGDVSRDAAPDACEESAPRLQAPAGGVRGSDGVQRAGVCDCVRTPGTRAGRGVAGGGACGGAAAMSAVFRAVQNT